MNINIIQLFLVVGKIALFDKALVLGVASGALAMCAILYQVAIKILRVGQVLIESTEFSCYGRVVKGTECLLLFT